MNVLHVGIESYQWVWFLFSYTSFCFSWFHHHLLVFPFLPRKALCQDPLPFILYVRCLFNGCSCRVWLMPPNPLHHRWLKPRITSSVRILLRPLLNFLHHLQHCLSPLLLCLMGTHHSTVNRCFAYSFIICSSECKCHKGWGGFVVFLFYSISSA